MVKDSRLCLVLAAATVVWGCGGDSQPGPVGVPDPPTPTSATVTPATATLRPTETVTLSAEIRDQYGNVISSVTVQWTAQDTSVAVVAGTGAVTARRPGTTQVVAVAGVATSSATITVVAWGIASVAFAEDTVRMDALGDSALLVVAVTDSSGAEVANPELSWDVEDTTVARVSGTGVLRPEAAGRTRVFAVSQGQADTAVVVVDPRPARISVSPDTVVLNYIGSRETVSATVFDRTGVPIPDARPAWTSADTAVAAVRVPEDGSAVVEAAGAGTTTVTVRLGEISADVEVVVRQVPASVAFPEDTVRMDALGDSALLVVAVTDSSGAEVANPELSWDVEDTTVARVSGTGVLMPEAAGRTRVFAVSQGQADTAVVVVDPKPARISVSPDAVVLNYIGSRETVSATVFDRTGVPIPDARPAWTSADTAVAAVRVREDGSAVVEAAGAGATTVTVRLEEISADVEVVVRQVPAAVDVSPSELVFSRPGRSQVLTAAVSDSGGVVLANPSVTWRSGNPRIAAVDGAGVVTARAPGRTVVSAATGVLSATAAVIVNDAAPLVSLLTDSTVAAGAAFDVAVSLDMAGERQVAGAVAVRISFDPALVRYDPDGETETGPSSYWAAVHDNTTGLFRIVVSDPDGLGAPSTVATIPFRAVGAAGSDVTLGLSVVQVVAAGSYNDISRLLAAEGTRTRIR